MALFVVGTAWLTADQGGYWPTSWGWAALGFAWVAVVSLLLRTRVVLGRLEVATLGAFAALFAWMLLATTWTVSVSATMREAERLLVPIAGLGALLLVARRRSTGAVLLAVASATTAVGGWSLLTRLLPDRFGAFQSLGGYRLSGLVGYWNGLGVLCALGFVLSVGLAARAPSPARQALAASFAPVLATALYFTYSRGAAIAAACGLLVAIAIDPRRVQLVNGLLVAAAPAAVVVWIASGSDALGTRAASIAAAARDGHRLLALLLLICAASAAATYARSRLESVVRVPHPVERAYGRGLAGVALLALLLAFAQWGSPVTIARNGYDSFVRGAPAPDAPQLKQRLLSFSGSGRATLWHAASEDAAAHPLLGSGPGTYEAWWLQHRPVPLKVRDAHNLYLETLAEQGPVGLVLLLLALALPLAAVRRVRHDPIVPIAAGAYCAFLLHAAIDWDWELSGVTLTAVSCGGVLLVAARREPQHALGPRARAGALVAAAIVGVLALGTLAANVALARSANAAKDGHWADSAAWAARARTYAPWSSEPLQLEALAQPTAATARPLFLRAIAKDRGNWQLWLQLAWSSQGDLRRHALAQAARLNPLSPEIAEYRRRQR
jgi:hypothetical protein